MSVDPIFNGECQLIPLPLRLLGGNRPTLFLNVRFDLPVGIPMTIIDLRTGKLITGRLTLGGINDLDS
jgi:hypothetical protein